MQIPLVAQRYAFGGAMTALTKPMGGIRPIIGGDAIVRVTERSIATEYKVPFAEFLMPTQLGVAVMVLSALACMMR